MKKLFSATVTLWVVLLMVFALGSADGISGTRQTTLLDTNQAGSLTKGSDIVPLNSQSNMLQFRAGGHILGFQPTRAYLASLDHALSVEFLHTKGVMPQSTTGTTTTNSLTKAPELAKVLYENLWKGINLTYETTQDGVTESTYHIAPGADVSQIKLRYNVPVTAQKDGSLKFTFERGYMTESKPVAWQDINGKRIPVTVAFNMKGDEVGFSVGTYNPRKPLIIDPTYAWHTFYGSSSRDGAYRIAVDTGGNVYVTGYSEATWGSPLHVHSGDYDIFVLKLNSSGAYQWHTFYGSSGDDAGYGIAVDTGGNIYVTGYSYATWGTPLHAFSGGYDIFVLKLNSSGAYAWHTFYGSTNEDGASGIAVDTGGNVYVTGYSYATWGSPLHAHSGGADIFVLKLNSSGAYQWHTFYGSSSSDVGLGIALDTGGNIYVTGGSEATWGSPLNAFSGGYDIFVLKLNSSGAYAWHTFYGSTNEDGASGIAVDTGGNVYVTGYSYATWGSPLHAHSGGADIFVLKLNSSGAYQWHTFYGASGTDDGQGIAVDTGGNVYVTGYSYDPWGSPLHAFSGGYDIFVLKLNSSGAYQWHTFYGSTNENAASGIAVNTGGNVYVTGYSYDPWGSPLHAHSGSSDIFVLKLNVSSLLYANFTGYGLYKYDDSWSRITTMVPSKLAASWRDLYAYFSGYGIYQYNGTWSRITTLVPNLMTASASDLYVYFASYGIYKYNGTAFSRITTLVPALLTASGTDLYTYFSGYGVYKYNGTTWSKISTMTPSQMAASGSDLYAYFSGNGIYKYNGTWSKISTMVPASMVASGTDLYAYFSGNGIYKYNGAWSRITTMVPSRFTASDTELYAYFAGYGIYKYDGTAWSKITTLVPNLMAGTR